MWACVCVMRGCGARVTRVCDVCVRTCVWCVRAYLCVYACVRVCVCACRALTTITIYIRKGLLKKQGGRRKKAIIHLQKKKRMVRRPLENALKSGICAGIYGILNTDGKRGIGKVNIWPQLAQYQTIYR